MVTNSRRRLIAVVAVLGLLTAVLLALGLAGERGQPEVSLMTREPLVPTRTPAALKTAAPSATRLDNDPTSAPASTAAMPTAVIPTSSDALPFDGPVILPTTELERYGVGGAIDTAARAGNAGLRYGSLLNWAVEPSPPAPASRFWQMVRLQEEGIRETSWSEIEETLRANPGAFWLIGNEPDVKWQDNVTPERYAQHYHDLYTFIKEHDPGAKVVIGGVSQPTPLRRAYLDRVLAAYQQNYAEPLPVDVWNVHAFTLREEAGSWGVDIPPGMDGAEGTLYEIADHDNLAILQQNLFDFRAWMAERGYANHPLVVSEYGILMPEDYGFAPERVAAFMTGTFDIFRTAANSTGYAPDGDRLVQWWFWYSVSDPKLYPTGNLWDKDQRALTPLGEAWTAYVDTAVAP